MYPDLSKKADFTRSEHKIAEIASLFDRVFFSKFNTRLLYGFEEPIYLPADKNCSYNRICSSYDYPASALHEVAHWCIAGSARRKLVDYGYWYEPDGRTPEQQSRFEEAEVKPQALEWIFAVAADLPFRVSADNIGADIGASDAFKNAIADQAKRYCIDGLSQRSAFFVKALAGRFDVQSPLALPHYQKQFLF